MPAALYAPPTHRRFWLQTSYFWERLGRRFEPRVVAGALLVEASKQVFARPPLAGSKVAVPGPLDVLEGLAGAQARTRRAATAGALPRHRSGDDPAPPASRIFMRPQRIATPPEPLLSPRRFRWGRGAPFR